MSSTTSLPQGTLLLQRYLVERAIGQGGFGSVYEVVDQHLNARRALKQVIGSTSAQRAVFQREAQLLANLQHQSLPHVYDHFQDTAGDFLVMDFVNGPNIADLIKQQGALPVDKVLAWALTLLDVLVYLHSREQVIIHRDIKPDNIKITPGDVPILLDFGIAKGNAGAALTTSTEQSVAAFTRSYAPIEQLLGMPTTVQSDLFSLGATLYHMLTAQLPVEANKRQDALNNGYPDPLKPVHQVNGRISTPVSQVIQQLLALRASDRPSSAADARQALYAARNGPSQAAGPAATELGTTEEAASVAPPLPMKAHAVPPSLVVRHPARHNGQPAGGRESAGSLQKRIHALVRGVFDRYPGAWMVWCDPKAEWHPLLERVAADARLGTFPLIVVTEQTANVIGGLQDRQRVQAQIESGESFVLLIQAEREQLGWLWAQALLAEASYSTSLREQLLAWGWQPQTASVSEQELAVLARQGLQHDPAAWGGGSLQPDLPLLLEVLAGGAVPEPDQSYLLDTTIQAAGLPTYDEQAVERWRLRTLAHLLVTQAHQAAPRLVSEANELLVSETARPTALELLARWVDSLRLSRGLSDAIIEADKIAVVGTQVREATVKQEPFLSRTAEQSVFTTTCTRLSQKTGKDLLQTFAAMHTDLERHARSFWGDRSGNADPAHAALALPWSELIRLSSAAQLLLDVAPSTWSTPAEAVRWYTSGGWRLDSVGEDVLRNLSRSTPELLTVVAALREAYRARWERTLIDWSEAWSKAGCPLPALPTAGSWLKQTMASTGATAILMIDALRYDLGATLAAQINRQEGTDRALVTPARAPLPSITALGMGLALPLHEQDTTAELIDGRWHLIETHTQLDLSIAEKRRAWLRGRKITDEEGILSLNDVVRGTVPRPGKGRMAVVITDDLIDQLGHDDELELSGTGAVLERYRTAITQLRDAGWRRVLVVTDHGYIHWAGNDDKRLPPPFPNPPYRARRALAYPATTTTTQPNVLAPGGKWRILPIPGTSSWSAYGKLGYFHGGASLQEWIIPCIQIEWPSQAEPIQVAIQPIKHILSAQPRLTLRVQRTRLLVEDTLSRQVEVLIRHATSRVILFRSAHLEIAPDQDTIGVTLRRTPAATAPRDTALRIEVRDTLTEEVIDTIDSVLAVELDDW